MRSFAIDEPGSSVRALYATLQVNTLFSSKMRLAQMNTFLNMTFTGEYISFKCLTNVCLSNAAQAMCGKGWQHEF